MLGDEDSAFNHVPAGSNMTPRLRESSHEPKLFGGPSLLPGQRHSRRHHPARKDAQVATLRQMTRSY